MGYSLLQNQSTYGLVFGPIVLASDHISPATGKTLTVTISKNGASFAAPAGAVTEVGNGWYKVAGNATDENTLGPLMLHATEGTIDPFDDTFYIVSYNPFDAAALGLTRLDAAITSRSTLDGAGVQTAMTSQGYTTARAVYLDTLNGLVQAVWDKATSALSVVGSIGKLLVDNINATISSRAAPADILATPANKLVTDASGNVSLALSMQTAIAGAVWDSPRAAHTTAGTFGEKIAAVAGQVQIDMAQSVPMADRSGDTTISVGSALNGAWVQAAGKWDQVSTSLTLKNADNTTFRGFTLDSSTVPTYRH